MIRSEKLGDGEHYHIYNRGVDKRRIVSDEDDSDRFVKCLAEFNTVKPTGGLYELSFNRPEINNSPLVEIVAYCLNPNHFHLILKQVVSNGISKYIQRLCGGYSRYFNKKYKRRGSLFQGAYKLKHVDDNDYLLHLSAYVNQNHLVHQLSNPITKLVRSSMSEYLGNEGMAGICSNQIILEQFDTRNSYGDFAKDSLVLMLDKRPEYKELEHL